MRGELDRITGTWRKLGRIIRDATWISNSSTSVHFFLFRLSQSAALLVCHLNLPPNHHITTVPPPRWWHSALVFFARAKTKLSRPGCEATGNERQDERQHFPSSTPRKRKNNDDDILEGNASIHHVLFFFFFHVHLHGNVTWSFNRSSFILTTFIPPFLFFSVWPIFQMIGGKWCGFIFKVDWMPLAAITESNRAVAVGHRALCQEPKRLSYNTLDYIPQSLTKKTIDRFVPSFLSSRPISDKVRRFKFHPFSISLKNHWIQIYSTSNVSSSQPVRYWNSSLRHQLELLTSP